MKKGVALAVIALILAAILLVLLTSLDGYLLYKYNHGWDCADAALFTSNILDKTRIPYKIVYGDDLKDHKVNNAHVWIDLQLPGGKAISLDWYDGGTKWNRYLIQDKTQLIQWAKNN